MKPTKTIWKFSLAVTDIQTIQMPEGAEPLTVAVQGTEPCLWARVDPAAPLTSRIFLTHGTGLQTIHQTIGIEVFEIIDTWTLIHVAANRV